MRLSSIRGRASSITAAVASMAILLAVAVPAAAAPEGQKPGSKKYAKDQVIVSFKPKASKTKRNKALARVETKKAKKPKKVSKLAPNTVIVELAPGQTVNQAIDTLSDMPGVAYVEPDYWVTADQKSNDPYFKTGQHWGMYGDASSPANKFGSGAAEAWAKGHVGKRTVYVGVIDEGIKFNHPDLSANVWTNPHETVNGKDDDGNGFIDDIHGWDFYHDDRSVYDGAFDDHGTHVAGTIGARGGNGIGVAGVNWKVTLIPAKFLGPSVGFSSDAARALDYLTDLKTRHGLNIVATNNSWGGDSHSQTLLDAINRAGDAGILFVAAAGNQGQDIDASPHYPAAYRCTTKADSSPRGWDCIISVANIRSNGTLSGSSNRGSVGADLGAPGTGIYSTVPLSNGKIYAAYSGTSMSAPHVTGAAALCASIDHTATAAQIRNRIMSTAKATSSLSTNTVTGSRLDIGALANLCASAAPTPTPQPTPTTPPVGATLTVDDLSPWFRRNGFGWRQGSTGGYAGHHYWVPARQAGKKRTGSWRPNLAQAGHYEIKVRVSRYHSTSRRAAYKVLTSSGWVSRTRNQFANRGKWVSLGTHHLGTTPMVLLADKTGERASLGRRLSYDAVRFIPVAAPSSSSSETSPTTSSGAGSGGQRSASDAQPTPGPTPMPAAEPGPTPEPAT